MKIMLCDNAHSIPADITRPSIFELSCVRIHITICFSENYLEVCSALVFFQALARLPR
jgi:hypothetical protein